MKRALVASWLLMGLATMLPAQEKLSLKDWDHLVSTLAAGQSPEVRAQWAATLVKQFAADKQAVAALPAEEFDLLSKLVAGLDAKQGSDLAAARASDATILANAEVTELAALALATSKTNREVATKVLAALEKNYQAAKNQFTWTDCMSVGRTFNGLADLPAAQKWGMRAYQCLLGTAKARDAVVEKQLVQLAAFFREIHLNGNGKIYPEFAAALAALGRAGSLSDCDKNWRDACGLGWLLDVPDTRQVLEKELVDGNGKLRVPVGKVLCWAYVTADQDAGIFSLLDKRLAQPTLAGKERIPWLELRAYAASLRGDPSPSMGEKWLVEAFDLGEDQELKLDIASTLILDLAENGKHDAALSFLNHALDVITTGEGQALLADLRTRVNNSRIAYLKAQYNHNRTWSQTFANRSSEAVKAGDVATARLFAIHAQTYSQQAQSALERLRAFARQTTSAPTTGSAQSEH